MSPRARVIAGVAAASVAAVAVVALAARGGDGGSPGPATTAAAPEPRAGAPPLALDLGLRDDAEARELRRAAQLYARGRRAQAGRLFARHRSLEARVGAALAAWPDRSVSRLAQLAQLFPDSAAVQLHLGLARFWAGRPGAEDAWRAAAEAAPDSSYAVTAGTLLHPQFAPGLPTFVPSFEPPAGVARLAPRAQLARLRADRSVRGLLLYGVALQRLGHPLSARRVYDRAARLAPGNAEAQVAAAVARFDKERPELAFGRLGPLTRRFPRAPTVRFHLGLLLLWTGRVDAAEAQLRKARAVAPGSPIAMEAGRWLARLEDVRKK